MDHITLIQFILLPFWAIGFFIAPISKRQIKYWTIVGCVIYIIYNLRFISSISYMGPSVDLFEITLLEQVGLKLNFLINPIRGLFLLFNAVFFLLVCLSYLRTEKNIGKKFLMNTYFFYWFSSLTIISGDLITFYIFLELTFLMFIFSTMPLEFQDFRKKIGKFLIHQSIGSGLLLFGILILASSIYRHHDVIDFNFIGEILRQEKSLGFNANNLAYLSLMIGFLVKAGCFPFHNGFFNSLKFFNFPQRLMAQITFVSLSLLGVVAFINGNFPQYNQSYTNLFMGILFVGMFFGLSSSFKANSFKEFAWASPLAIIPFVFMGTILKDIDWIMGVIIYFLNYSLGLIGIIYLLNLPKKTNDPIHGNMNQKLLLPGACLAFFILSCLAVPFSGGFTGFILIFSKLREYSPFLGLFSMIYLAILIYGFSKKWEGNQTFIKSGEILTVRGFDFLVIGVIFTIILGLGIFPNFLFESFFKIPM